MGANGELYIDNYPVFSSKSQVSAILMTVFRETDKRTFDRKSTERNRIEPLQSHWHPEEIDSVIEYSATVTQVCDRLRVMGFTLSQAETDFLSSKQAYLADLRQTAPNSNVWAEEIAILESTSFRDFLNAFREILNTGVRPGQLVTQNQPT